MGAKSKRPAWTKYKRRAVTTKRSGGDTSGNARPAKRPK